MRRPAINRDLTPKVVIRTCNGVELRDLGPRTTDGGGTSRSGRDRIGNRLASSSTGSSNMVATLQGAGAGVSGTAASRTGNVVDDDEDLTASFSPEVVRAIEGVKFIAEHLKQEDEARYVSVPHVLYVGQCPFLAFKRAEDLCRHACLWLVRRRTIIGADPFFSILWGPNKWRSKGRGPRFLGSGACPRNFFKINVIFIRRFKQFMA